MMPTVRTPRFSAPPRWARLVALAILPFVLSQSGCAWLSRVCAPFAPREPRSIAERASLAEVIGAVNDNSDRVRTLATTDASVSVMSFPPLRATLAFERPRRFRLKARLFNFSPEADLGSNNELFWFWIARNQPPALYYCRHDEYEISAAPNMLPVEPDWLIEALGVTRFDPGLAHQGPAPLGKGRLEIVTPLPSSDGRLVKKITVLDDAHAWVLEQHLYGANGLVASALTSGHKRDPASGVVLPTKVEIRWPASNFEMTIDLRGVQVNRPLNDNPDLWELPNYTGYASVDLADPNLGRADGVSRVRGRSDFR